MKRILLPIVLLIAAVVGNAQSLENFDGLRSKGQIPDDFTTLTSEKYETDLKNNSDKELDKEFFLSTRFFIDELLLSGKILFNEPLSIYLNKVAKYTLKNEPKLLKELRFYVLKTNTVNAFSTDQGIIVFTTGLMAQLENEAQLAYIIAHEVSHYTEHHVRNSYVERKSFSKKKGRYERLTYESRISELSIYEKDTELEADQKGIDIYMQTEYAIDEIFSSFEMLLYSYLPFDDVKFDSTFFNASSLIIPGNLFPDSVSEIKREVDYDDKNSTHPNIKKRIDAALDYTEDKTFKGDKKFVVGEDEFNNVRNLARFETINQMVTNRNYVNAIYAISLMQKEFDNNRFLDLSLVRSLYGLSKYKNSSRFNEVTTTLSKVEGESYALHHFFKQLSKQQLAVLAYRWVYDINVKYPNDKTIAAYEADMKKELATKSKIDIKKFKSKSFEEQEEEVLTQIDFDVEDSIKRVEESDLSKYEKIRLKKKLRDFGEIKDGGEEAKLDSEFHYYGLTDVLTGNKNFQDELFELKEVYESELLAKNSTNNWRQRKEFEPVGAKKIVLIDPVFEKYDLKSKRKHKDSEDKKLNLNEMFEKDYPKLDLETTLISSKNLKAKEVSTYNEIGLIFQWISEVISHEDIDMISSKSEEMMGVKEKFGTNHFVFTGFYTYKDRNQFTASHLLGIISVYGIPFVLADLLIIHNYIELLAISINSDTDKIEFIQATEINLKESNKVINAYVYDILYQLNKAK
ncbi:M48 family metallopeptidase [Crocinitomix catalasitica]|uniref:M48 family metallopeptidase n=1 Tax=Crocinitomix catalasitica TaxID=184607 RepID=UPI000487F4B9|nr:M48 family metallopeptidase [Crocinitomix catalasitica]